MEAGFFVGLPVSKIAGEQAIFGQQQFVTAFPSTELEQATVAPQVVHDLQHHISEEGVGHIVKNANAPFFIAAQSFLNIKGGATVFGFFGRVPLPHGFEARFSAFKNLGMAQ